MTVKTGYSTIQEFSDAITDLWQVKFGSLIAEGAAQYQEYTKVVPTEGYGARIRFIDTWQKLDDVEKNQDLNIVTTIPTMLTENFGRKGKILQISTYDWM